MTASYPTMHSGQVDAGRVGEVTRGVGSMGAAAVTAIVEVVLGVGRLFLFVLALMCDPIDRRFSARGKRIAERGKRLAATPSEASEGAYAILPAD